MSGLVPIPQPPMLVRVTRIQHEVAIVGYAWIDEAWFPRFGVQHATLSGAIQDFRDLLRASRSFHGTTSRRSRSL